MTLDDEEDFSPEILDHFDLVCTQFATGSAPEVCNGSHPENHLIPAVQNQGGCGASNSQQPKPRGSVIRLSRKTTFGRICSWAPTQPPSAPTDESYKIEIERLKREVGALREELYVKVGELASIKEASSRSTNARLEVIRKLEAQLASERAESAKTIAALNSQLAFREADYQLVSTELTQAKMMQSCHSFPEDEPSTSFPQVAANVSPASALLTSIAEGVDARLAKRGGCFPRPVSPSLTRVTPSKRPRLWNDELVYGTSAGSSASGTPSNSPSPTILRQGGVKVRPLRPLFKLPPLDLTEEAESPPTPCKQIPSTDLMGDDLVAPTPPPPPPPPSPPQKLRFRLRHGDGSSKNSDLCQILGRLTLLSGELRCLPRDPKLPGLAVSETTDEERCLVERDFFSGLSRLSLAVEGCVDVGKCLDECIPLILPQIRTRFQEYVNFFRLYRRRVFDHTFTQKLQRDDPVEFESNSPDSSGIIDLKRLDENPFAGAPASQLVSIPSLCIERNTRSTPVNVEVVEPSTWIESTALQASEEVLNELAAMLSLKPVDEETTLNSLPALWMSRLACISHKCLHLACRFAIELKRMSSQKKCDSASSWLPSILNVYLLVVCEMCSGPLEKPLVLLPALRLSTYLLESGRLDPPDHSTAASNSAVSWWASGGDAEALELLQRLQELEVSLDQASHPSSSNLTFHISSKIPPQEQLGCPLHILCRLVHFRQSILDGDDVRRLCRLLTEFSMFTAALASTKRWTWCANCPCTLEVYKALIGLGLPVVDWLFAWKLNPDLKILCLSSLGCLTQALHTLLLTHGDDTFQLITNRIPGFFIIISRLSRLSDDSVDLVHPELVEELHDFDASPRSNSMESS
ncbi:hypothetical protein TcWFU_000325 [Taenia crassiceps]|uniref:Uncharacterized protein n=1 Tax=Taenia crassiceps TaxID=6207 RepID=A0ABR4Q1M8_9CEST